ncbi:SGNH/GDSL hydrolase family protein [Mucilaginibacter gynuensis]|uniref:SGNH/GDSL hydrolase family protein n=1 Tax=Mucilaginibacter gynuensis TaxID=1302236 RepID=A0ABP8FN69_9SPHI
MIKFRLSIVSFALVVFLNACQAQQFNLLKSSDKRIHYTGRVALTDTAAVLSWTGNSATISFNGTSAKAILKDETGENNFNVIIDNKVTDVIHPDKEQKEYTLASNLKPGKHTLQLFKRTEWAMGKTWFYGFKLDGDKVYTTPPKKRKIEFFGNSITCGYAVEDSTGQDRGTAQFENGYISYAAITARHFDAEYYCTAKSGIGITISWFPLVMPEMYDRLDATNPNSKWDFNKYIPDLVVINLLQNDSWLTLNTQHPEYKKRFGDKAPTPEFIISAYRDFVKSVRSKYPKAQIICALGNMDATKTGSPWPGYIEKAVASLNDKAIYMHFFPYKNTSGHPNPKEQQVMADDLIRFIDEKVKW